MILKLDLKDFFDSISFAMVYEWAFPNVYFPPPVRMLLTNLCCYQGTLPQGAPTSSYISNLVWKELDEQLRDFAKLHQMTYTRYCDDLTFSGTFDPKFVLQTVKSKIFPFQLNPKKTQLLRPHQRQLITGIVVNQKPQMKKIDRNHIRQELYYIKKFGLLSHLQRRDTKSSFSKEEPLTYCHQLLGRIQYGLFLCPNDQELNQYRNQVLTLIHSHEKKK